jgi:hypothetical protein
MKMGCRKEKIEKLLLSSFVITLIFIAVASPIVIGVDDTVVITFDPTGSVTLATKPTTLDCGTPANGSEDESATAITLYNNGSAPMTTSIDTNATTESGNLTLDPDGGTIIEDYYSVQITTSSCSEGTQYFTDTLTAYNDTLPPDDSTTFKITVWVGDISENFNQERTTLNFTGTLDT